MLVQRLAISLDRISQPLLVLGLLHVLVALAE